MEHYYDEIDQNVAERISREIEEHVQLTKRTVELYTETIHDTLQDSYSDKLEKVYNGIGKKYKESISTSSYKAGFFSEYFEDNSIEEQWRKTDFYSTASRIQSMLNNDITGYYKINASGMYIYGEKGRIDGARFEQMMGTLESIIAGYNNQTNSFITSLDRLVRDFPTYVTIIGKLKNIVAGITSYFTNLTKDLYEALTEYLKNLSMKSQIRTEELNLQNTQSEAQRDELTAAERKRLLDLYF